MTDYLSYEFNDTPGFIETFDELPLWSAPFGLLLLKHIELKPNLTVLDIGSGAGFPLLELAQRLGASSRCFGLDPWKNANERARKKIRNYGLANVEVLDGSADKIPFNDSSIDMIVSNLGINNFERPGNVFRECHRVLKRNGKLALTTNLYGHWKEFYTIFEATLLQLGKRNLAEKLKEEEEHRGTINTVSKLFTENGFTVKKCIEDTMEMKFLDGSAFLRHHFVKLGWLTSWKNVVPKVEQVEVFQLLETNLNGFAHQSGGLNLTVPMAFFQGEK